jgi:hypothetical protein
MKIDEGLVRLTQALVETKHLRDWFFALQDLPKAARNSAFSEMSAKMRAAGEDAQLANAVSSLTNPQVYKSVLQTALERSAEHRADWK